MRLGPRCGGLQSSSTSWMHPEHPPARGGPGGGLQPLLLTSDPSPRVPPCPFVCLQQYWDEPPPPAPISPSSRISAKPQPLLGVSALGEAGGSLPCPSPNSSYIRTCTGVPKMGSLR